ncbi:hypothetical protein KJ865_12850, partial [Myxococcota bacterium]|nr:hypothetical protein [Myxococcota bacterium]
MNKTKKTVFTVLFLSIFTFTSCGYILYPQRRNSNARGGQMDVAVLVMDILWLLPGIIPGIVAIAVDASTGAWYKSGGPTILGEKKRAEKPTMLAANRRHFIQFKNSKSPCSTAKLYHVSSTGLKSELATTKVSKENTLPFTFTVPANMQNDRGWLM